MNVYLKLPYYLIKIIGGDLSGIINDIDSLRLPPDAKIILHKMKDLIIERFNVFKGEIENQEANVDCYTILDLSNEPKMTHIGYSKNTIKKMEESITKDDWIYLEKLITGQFGTT